MRLEATGVIPTYNNEDTIEEAVDSLLSQSQRIEEIVVTDDNSEDDTLVKVHKNFKDPRITILRNKFRLGTSENLNRGIAAAKSPVVITMGADDISLVDRWRVQSQFFLDSHASVVASDFLTIDHKGELNPNLRADYFQICKDCDSNFERMFWHGNYICAPAVSFTKKWFHKVGGFNGLLQLTNDFELWMKAALENTLCLNDKIVVKYRVSDYSQTSLTNKNFSYSSRISRFEHQIIYEALFDNMTETHVNILQNSKCKKKNNQVFEFHASEILGLKLNIFLSHDLPLVKEIGLKKIIGSMNNKINIDHNMDNLRRKSNSIYRDMISWCINYD